MGSKELIDSLRASGSEKMRALRAEAEQEADRIRADAATRIEDVRQRHERQRRAETEKLTEELLARAQEDARRVRIRSERAMAGRLAALARSSLSTLRNEGYEGVFTSFASELPRLSWKKVQVNPRDVALAKAHFPGAEILLDEAISGGMVAISDGDRVRIVNTFEKRLERKWEDMLPDIMRAVLERGR